MSTWLTLSTWVIVSTWVDCWAVDINEDDEDNDEDEAYTIAAEVRRAVWPWAALYSSCS